MTRLNDLPNTFTRFVALPYTPKIGAYVHGLDVSKPLDELAQSELKAALAQFQVLFFEDQKITPDQQVTFTRIFGHVNEVKAFFPRVSTNSINACEVFFIRLRY